MVCEYVEHTSPKTRKVLQDALAKVLFIRGTYRLSEGTFVAEAVNELVHFLGQSASSEKMVIILAGDIVGTDKLMSKRPDLSGIFGTRPRSEKTASRRLCAAAIPQTRTKGCT